MRNTFVAAIACLVSSFASAETLNYVETISGVSGALGATTFTDAELVLRAQGDPGTFTIGTGYFIGASGEQLVDPTVTISGVGTFNLSQTFGVGYSSRGGVLSIGSSEGELRAYSGPSNPDGSYFTVAQPVSFTASGVFVSSTLAPVASFQTSGGILSLPTGSGAYPLTYSASTVTPEPSSFALLGTGLLGIAGATRRRFA